MDATLGAAVAAVVGTVVTGLAAMYGSRLASRATREGGVLTGYDSLTDQLQEERRDLKTDVATLKAEAAAKDAEIARLRLAVQQLGGTP